MEDPAQPATPDEIYLVEEDLSVVAAFARREDAEAYCRAARAAGSLSDWGVTTQPLQHGPSPVYAARVGEELLGIYEQQTRAVWACEIEAHRRRPTGGSYSVVSHSDGRAPIVVWSSGAP